VPLLINNRHELFAQGLAAGKTADQAYVDAGFKANSGNAARLNGDERIQARVGELKAASAESVQLTREWVLSKLINNARVALGEIEQKLKLVQKNRNTGEILVAETIAHHPDKAAANKALELLGKEIGMFVERVNSENTTRLISDKPMTESEWLEQFGE
jgi:phage terminase small subunit